GQRVVSILDAKHSQSMIHSDGSTYKKTDTQTNQRPGILPGLLFTTSFDIRNDVLDHQQSIQKRNAAINGELRGN
ncbi:MAG: hypothetical protein ACLGQW_11405, partial [Acidobacteriota bacterium]